MWIVIISFIVFCLAFSAMAIGTLLGGKRIQGSCGGIARIPGIESDCDACETACDGYSLKK
ncbi:MAG: (Na+)-NQR maturation NqrM [Leptospirillia bacterium]